MAVSDHMRIASAELRRAAELLKQEIENLRNEETNVNRSINDRVAFLLRQQQQYEHDLRVTNDPAQSSQLHSVIQRINLEIAQKRSEVRSHQERIQSMIRDKQRQIGSLESQARMIAS